MNLQIPLAASFIPHISYLIPRIPLYQTLLECPIPPGRHAITFMNETQTHLTTRRTFLKNTGTIAAASALAGVAIPHVHAAPNNTTQLALVGCGGRGTGAVGNALGTKGGPVTLAAMADVFEHRLNGSYDTLKKQFSDLIDVPQDKKFIG